MDHYLQLGTSASATWTNFDLGIRPPLSVEVTIEAPSQAPTPPLAPLLAILETPTSPPQSLSPLQSSLDLPPDSVLAPLSLSSPLLPADNTLALLSPLISPLKNGDSDDLLCDFCDEVIEINLLMRAIKLREQLRSKSYLNPLPYNPNH